MTHSAHWQKAIPSPVSNTVKPPWPARASSPNPPVRWVAWKQWRLIWHHCSTVIRRRPYQHRRLCRRPRRLRRRNFGFPQAVTGQMIANFVAGGAISVMANLGATLEVINLGTATRPLSAMA